jgi:hypothetical protein
MRLVAFTPGGVSGDSTDFHMDDNGDWTATLAIPSSTYRYEDIKGVKRVVNCRQVQCGVFTIGAHGKASSTNERFTPIIFTATPTVTTTPTTPPATTPTTSATTTPPTAAGGGVPVGPDPTAPDGANPTTSTTTRRSAGATGARGPNGKTSTTRATSTTTTSRGGEAGSENRASATPTAATSSGPNGAGPPALWIATGLVALAGIGGGTWLRLSRRRAH